MLGHDSLLVESSSIFKCVDCTFTPMDAEFLDYFTVYVARRHPDIMILREVLGDASLLDFLHVFAGMTIEVPVKTPKKGTTYSLLPEVLDQIGPERMVAFLELFSGRNLLVIPHRLLASSLRDVDIYLQISRTKAISGNTTGIVSRLTQHYQVNVWWIFVKAQKFFGEGL